MNFLTYYIIGYSVLVFAWLWWRIFLVTSVEEPNWPFYDTSFSVVIPSFNEDPAVVEESIKSVLEAAGDKEIILIDDGSAVKGLRYLAKKYPIKYIEFDQNKGKREAQAAGFRAATKEIIITLDSDTKLYKDSLLQVSKPFSDKKIGAATCVLELWNKDENLFTRILHGRFLNAFLFERCSQSAYGGVNCCFGGFSAYRREVVMKNIDDYLGQTFLGVKCTFGDDRHLTNLMLKTHDVVTAPDAKAATMGPNNSGLFIKQQKRWMQSFTRENLVTFKVAWKQKKWLLFIDTAINALLPFISLPIRILMIATVIMAPWTLIYYLFIIALMGFTRNLIVIVEHKKEAGYCVLYAMYHAFVVYWIYFIALYKLLIQRKNGWGTR